MPRVSRIRDSIGLAIPTEGSEPSSLRAGFGSIPATIRRQWDKRPFSGRCSTRILLVRIEHGLARTQFEPFRRYRNRFAAIGIEFRSVTYGDAVRGMATPCADGIFLQSPYEPAAEELEAVLQRLRAGHPGAPISYFDWFAPTDIRLAERVDPFIEFYVKKSLLRDRAEYTRQMTGHTNLSEYYAATYGTDNPPATWMTPASVIPKLVTGPAFSTGKGLIERFEGAMPELDAPRPIDLHARLAVRGTDWYSFMRRQAAAAVSAISGLNVASQGIVQRKQYFAELGHSKLVFSPFGYGEICWRDFEAVAMGAVLIKPDMGHIEANPNIYIANETYVPVKWDFSDLASKVRWLLDEPETRKRIARAAFNVAHQHLCDGSLENLALRLCKRDAVVSNPQK